MGISYVKSAYIILCVSVQTQQNYENPRLIPDPPLTDTRELNNKGKERVVRKERYETGMPDAFVIPLQRYSTGRARRSLTESLSWEICQEAYLLFVEFLLG